MDITSLQSHYSVWIDKVIFEIPITNKQATSKKILKQDTNYLRQLYLW